MPGEAARQVPDPERVVTKQTYIRCDLTLALTHAPGSVVRGRQAGAGPVVDDPGAAIAARMN
jgi:hypothetical protein